MQAENVSKLNNSHYADIPFAVRKTICRQYYNAPNQLVGYDHEKYKAEKIITKLDPGSMTWRCVMQIAELYILLVKKPDYEYLPARLNDYHSMFQGNRITKGTHSNLSKEQQEIVDYIKEYEWKTFSRVISHYPNNALFINIAYAFIPSDFINEKLGMYTNDFEQQASAHAKHLEQCMAEHKETKETKEDLLTRITDKMVSHAHAGDYQTAKDYLLLMDVIVNANAKRSISIESAKYLISSIMYITNPKVDEDLVLETVQLIIDEGIDDKNTNKLKRSVIQYLLGMKKYIFDDNNKNILKLKEIIEQIKLKDN